MLDSRKRDMHKIIALTFETGAHGEIRKDFQSRIKLFSHWKAGGDFAKTASLALSIGKSFEEQCLNNQSIRLYSETLEMLKGADDILKSKHQEESKHIDVLPRLTGEPLLGWVNAQKG